MCHRADFRIGRGVQTLPKPVHDMAPIGAFSVLQKWPKISKMTPNDILTLAMVLTEPLVKTEKHGNIATYSL